MCQCSCMLCGSCVSVEAFVSEMLGGLGAGICQLCWMTGVTDILVYRAGQMRLLMKQSMSIASGLAGQMRLLIDGSMTTMNALQGG